MEKNKVSDSLISDRVEDVVSRRNLERIVEEEDLEGEQVPACVASDVGESDVGGSVGSMEKQLAFGNADSAPKGGDNKEGERCVMLLFEARTDGVEALCNIGILATSNNRTESTDMTTQCSDRRLCIQRASSEPPPRRLPRSYLLLVTKNAWLRLKEGNKDRLFWKWQQCGAKYLSSNQHNVCDLCLWLKHDEQDCRAHNQLKNKKKLHSQRDQCHAHNMEMEAEAEFSTEEEFVDAVREQGEDGGKDGVITCSPHYIVSEDSKHYEEEGWDEPSPPPLERSENPMATRLRPKMKTTPRADDDFQRVPQDIPDPLDAYDIIPPDIDVQTPVKALCPDDTTSYHSVPQCAADYHEVQIYTMEEEEDILVETLLSAVFVHERVNG
ncbi:hypothetical protein NDU88_000161 [Pleurodeles waltl]|uniref:Uncharacterized protein n=1 Tax=Pleurodeles waltl TaxID=8319 RepID=A0AAV7S701_PLEWA|nr:hypothetical protein NDU88_000161 [Pleurodeles waltl]